MMNCKDIQKVLKDYYHNKLSAADKEKVTEHLKSCEMCSEIFEMEKEFYAEFASIDNTSDVPEVLFSKIKRNVKEEINGVKRYKVKASKSFYLFVKASSLAVILLFIGFMLNGDDYNKMQIKVKNEIEFANLINEMSNDTSDCELLDSSEYEVVDNLDGGFDEVSSDEYELIGNF